MTKNEAKAYIENMQISEGCDLVKTLDFQATVIEALEKVQEYEAVGTVEEFRELKSKQTKHINIYECTSSFTVIGETVLHKVQIEKGQLYLLMFSNPTHVVLTDDNEMELRITHELFYQHFREVLNV